LSVDSVRAERLGNFLFLFRGLGFVIAFFGGLQLMILGIVGIYIGKIYMQGKNRPHYIIKETNLV
jgi:mannose/fructose/N-acetylgalactosamine-specific phosphotransferase system component IIC